ncbi:MAG: DNA-3-methyladenine glycosylase family protein [Parvularculaceae bacterium]
MSEIDVFSDVAPAVRALSRRDPALKAAARAIGAPVIRRRAGGFEGLFRIIVEQQVSVASAQAIWKRCGDGLDCMSPLAVASAGIEGLKAHGLSGPKARYVDGLARLVADGAFDLSALPRLSDADAAEALIAVKGIGPWTASIYHLFCEGRVDIWPPNDVALKHAYNAAAGEVFDQRALDARASNWSPFRGVAAHVLWTYYAVLKGRTPI